MSSGSRPRRRTAAKAQNASPKVESRQVVVFTVGQEAYAFRIEQVQEVIRYVRPRSVGSRSNSMRGVINLRGRVVPVYDLSGRLGVESDAGERAKIIIIECAGQVGGVLVDDVAEVQTITADQLEPLPIADTDLVDAIVKLSEQLVLLLKPEVLFAPDIT